MSKLLFLGTGTSQGVPMIGCPCIVCGSKDKHDKRLRSSVYIEENGVKFVIDTGPDFRYQMLRANIKEIDAVLFTHSHKDHISGMDDIRAYNYILKKSIDIYAEKHTMEVIKCEFHYAFNDKDRYPGVPEITPNIIDEKPFSVKNVEVIPIRAYHLKLPILGFRIGDISYLTDLNKISQTEISKMKGSKVLVIDALRKTGHISHLSLKEAISIAHEVNAEKTYFTHLSHQIGLYAEEEILLPSGMHFAYDELAIDTDKLL